MTRLLDMGLTIETVMLPFGEYRVRVTGGWVETVGVADTFEGAYLAAGVRWFN